MRLGAALSSRETRDLEVWFEIVLEVALPILGIILEGTNRQSAKWANIGWPTAAGILWLVEALWWRSDPFFGVLLILTVGMFTLAALMALVYWTTKSMDEPQQQPS